MMDILSSFTQLARSLLNGKAEVEAKAEASKLECLTLIIGGIYYVTSNV